MRVARRDNNGAKWLMSRREGRYGDCELSAYCDIAPGHEWHGPYHDGEYGFPVRDEARLFERLQNLEAERSLDWIKVAARAKDRRRTVSDRVAPKRRKAA